MALFTVSPATGFTLTHIASHLCLLFRLLFQTLCILITTTLLHRLNMATTSTKMNFKLDQLSPTHRKLFYHCRAVTLIIGLDALKVLEEMAFPILYLDRVLAENGVDPFLGSATFRRHLKRTGIVVNRLEGNIVRWLENVFPSVVDLTIIGYTQPLDTVLRVTDLLLFWSGQLECFKLHLSFAFKRPEMINESGRLKTMNKLRVVINGCSALQHLTLTLGEGFTTKLPRLDGRDRLRPVQVDWPILRRLRTFYYSTPSETIGELEYSLQSYARKNHHLVAIGLAAKADNLEQFLLEAFATKMEHLYSTSLDRVHRFISLTSVCLEQFGESMEFIKQCLADCKRLTTLRLSVANMNALVAENESTPPHPLPSIKILILSLPIVHHADLKRLHLDEHFPQLQLLELNNLTLPKVAWHFEHPFFANIIQCAVCSRKRRLAYRDRHRYCITRFLAPLYRCYKLHTVVLKHLLGWEIYRSAWPLDMNQLDIRERLRLWNGHGGGAAAVDNISIDDQSSIHLDELPLLRVEGDVVVENFQNQNDN